MTARKTERLLNLVICLLAARQYVTKERIRATVAGYEECRTDEAFERMFERDKDELREMGIPLETGSNDPWFDDEPGYRIRPSDYALPEVSLSPDEATVLGLAARVWQRASLARAASDAMLKLQAAGVDTDEVALPGIEPRAAGSEPAFEPLWQALRDRQAVVFPYRRGGASEAAARELEPWGIVSWHGHWYVAGHDRDRRATRVFRLDRIQGPVRLVGQPGEVSVPEGVDVRAFVAESAEEMPKGTARLRIREGAGFPLRRHAHHVKPDVEGWDVVEIPLFGAEGLAEWVATFGADVIALDPPELRDAVVRHLRAVADPDRPAAVGRGAS